MIFTCEFSFYLVENITKEMNCVNSKFKSRNSILRKFNITKKFPFKGVSIDYIKTIIRNIPTNKASGGEIILQILRKTDFGYIQYVFLKGKYLHFLTQTDLTQVHKKKTLQISLIFALCVLYPYFLKFQRKPLIK